MLKAKVMNIFQLFLWSLLNSASHTKNEASKSKSFLKTGKKDDSPWLHAWNSPQYQISTVYWVYCYCLWHVGWILEASNSQVAQLAVLYLNNDFFSTKCSSTFHTKASIQCANEPPTGNLCTRQRFAPSFPCLKHESSIDPGVAAPNICENSETQESCVPAERQMREARRKMKKSGAWKPFFFTKTKHRWEKEIPAPRVDINFIRPYWISTGDVRLGWRVSLRKMVANDVSDSGSLGPSLQPLRWIYPPPATVAMKIHDL